MITLTTREIVSWPVVSSAPGLGGGLPAAVTTLVDIGRPLVGFLVVDLDGGGSSRADVGQRLDVTIATGAEPSNMREASSIAIVATGHHNRSALEPVKLQRFVRVTARANVAGRDFNNVRVTLEHAT